MKNGILSTKLQAGMKNSKLTSSESVTVGWREWLLLPDLKLPWIKAKVDTGAKTSSLHAFCVEEFKKNEKDWVRFGIHPHQDDIETEIYCEAELIDKRLVSDSGGHTEERYVIKTDVVMASQRWPIEITLTNRDTMRFRFLLGRTAMRKKLIVNPAASFLLGELPSTTETK